MQNNILKKDEKHSLKYPGFIEKENGTFKKKMFFGKGRIINRYYVEKPCSSCGLEHLVNRENLKRQKTFNCSKLCKAKSISSPEGSKKRKRANLFDDHILIKVSGHPSAKNGYVAEHRIVIEEDIGRYLTAEERVHHINCIKEDNSLSNLALCKNDKEHFLAHGSLNKCVAELIKMGVLCFDKEKLIYFVRK